MIEVQKKCPACGKVHVTRLTASEYCTECDQTVCVDIDLNVITLAGVVALVPAIVSYTIAVNGYSLGTAYTILLLVPLVAFSIAIIYYFVGK